MGKSSEKAIESGNSKKKNAIDILMQRSRGQAQVRGKISPSTGPRNEQSTTDGNSDAERNSRKRSTPEGEPKYSALVSPSKGSSAANNHVRTNKKRSKSEDAGGSRFFPCPAGCGAHVTELNINSHLDQCFSNAEGRVHSVKNEDDSENAGTIDRNEPHLHYLHDGGTAQNQISIISQNIEEEDHLPSNATLSSPERPAKSLTPSKRNVEHRKELHDKNDAFAHMMHCSSAVFSKSSGENQDEVVPVRHRFHLHNVDGLVTWTVEDNDGNLENDFIGDGTNHDVHTGKGNAAVAPALHAKHKPRALAEVVPDDIQWSATVTIKKPKTIHFQQKEQKEQKSPMRGSPRKLHPKEDHLFEKPLELIISSSIPIPQDGKPHRRLVRRHSRLSVPHLKSCLQKSVRRRAPLPAVRVAMELADKSWGDFIRRLPIIILEDSCLHPDFPLLVWLMVADSKHYVPPMPIIVRVMQIVFECCSCPWQDILSGNSADFESQQTPFSFSLSTPSHHLFPDQNENIGACETFVRSMLLRAQYGGMSCDVEMLHSFAKTWLQRFQTGILPREVLQKALPASVDGTTCSWWDFPKLVHAKAMQQSKKLVTCKLVCNGGLNKLNSNDVCSAGIDFHCSSVVESLLSQPDLYSSLCEKLAPLKKSGGVNKDWIANQMKRCIWNYSSGINRRLPLFGAQKCNVGEEDSILNDAWNSILKAPFDDFTKSFVQAKLS